MQVICGTELGEVGTKPDIYCTLEADCNGEMCKKNKTKLMKGSINPIWDEVRHGVTFDELFIKKNSSLAVIIHWK